MEISVHSLLVYFSILFFFLCKFTQWLLYCANSLQPDKQSDLIWISRKEELFKNDVCNMNPYMSRAGRSVAEASSTWIDRDTHKHERWWDSQLWKEKCRRLSYKSVEEDPLNLPIESRKGEGEKVETLFFSIFSHLFISFVRFLFFLFEMIFFRLSAQHTRGSIDRNCYLFLQSMSLFTCLGAPARPARKIYIPNSPSF